MAFPLVGAAAAGISKAVGGIGGGKLALAGVGIGAAGFAGSISAMRDPEGPWRGMGEDVQDLVYGDPHAVRNAFAGAIVGELSSPLDQQTQGIDSYYYGRPVGMKPRRQTNPNNAPGDIVFGQYNLRR